MSRVWIDYAWHKREFEPWFATFEPGIVLWIDGECQWFTRK